MDECEKQRTTEERTPSIPWYYKKKAYLICRYLKYAISSARQTRYYKNVKEKEKEKEMEKK